MVVDAEDEFGNIATTYNGPVTISLANGATGLGRHGDVNAVAGVATFTTSRSPTTAPTISWPEPRAASTTAPSTPIVIVGAATELYIIQQPPSPVQAGSTSASRSAADDIFGNPTTIFPAKQRVGRDGANPGSSNPTAWPRPSP